MISSDGVGTSFRAAVPAHVWADLRGEGLFDQRAPVPA
jgi:hypothetical protein